MITDNNNVIYSDDKKTLINGSQCNAIIYNVPEGVECIDESAFKGNTNTYMLVLPHSCSSLGERAFAEMKNVECIDMENTQITEVPGSCFRMDEKLRCISFPRCISTILNNAFTGTGLDKLDLASDFPNVVFFAPYAFVASNVKFLTIIATWNIDFNDCKYLEKLTIPEDVKEINSYSFSGCTNLKEINLPDSLESIGAEAFADSPVEELTLPPRLRSLDSKCFKWGSLTHVSSLSPNFVVEDNTLYNADKSKVIGFWGGSVDSLKENQPEILPYAFRGNQKITELNLPNATEAYTPFCFEKMTSLKSVNIVFSYGVLGQYAFLGCINLTDVVLNEFYCLDDYAFYGCKELTTFKGDDICILRTHCFDGCTKLRNVSFHDIRIVEEYAFMNCNSITSIKLRDNQHTPSLCTLKRHCFDGMRGLKEIEIPEGVECLNHNFDNCVSLEKVKLPASIKKISFHNIGSNCPSLKEILVPKADLPRFQGMLMIKYHPLFKTY